MLKNENISQEEKIDIFYINIDEEKDLLSKIKYLKDNNRLDLINSCPENLLLCVLPGDTKPLINYFDKETLPKINGPMRSMEIVCKYYELKELSFFYENISVYVMKKEFRGCDTLFEFFLRSCIKDENKLNEFIEMVNKGYINNDYRFILAKYNIYLPIKNSKIVFDIRKNIFDFIYKNDDEQIVFNEEVELVDRFYNLFSDSSEDIVKLAIKSFYQTYSFDKERAIRDISLLMKFKENNSEFKLSAHETQNCFTKYEIHNPYSGLHLNMGITISNKNSCEIFNHELGHFLQYIVSENSFFEENVYNSSCPGSILDSIYAELIKLYSSLENESNEKYLKYVGDIDKYRNKLKQEFMDLYSSDNNDYIEYISSFIKKFEVIDKNDLCNIYVNNRIDKEKKIIHDELFRKKYEIINIFINFVNSYYKGYFHENNKLNLPIVVHCNGYIMEKSHQIDELFANFTALLRNEDGRKYIKNLRKVCSSELIDYLYQIDNLISNNYLESMNNKKNQSK